MVNGKTRDCLSPDEASQLLLPDLDLVLDISVNMLKIVFAEVEILTTTTLSGPSAAAEYPVDGPCWKVSSILCILTN